MKLQLRISLSAGVQRSTKTVRYLKADNSGAMKIIISFLTINICGLVAKGIERAHIEVEFVGDNSSPHGLETTRSTQELVGHYMPNGIVANAQGRVVKVSTLWHVWRRVRK